MLQKSLGGVFIVAGEKMRSGHVIGVSEVAVQRPEGGVEFLAVRLKVFAIKVGELQSESRYTNAKAKLERIIRTSDGFADFEETNVEDPVTGAITVKFAIWTTDKSVFDRFTAP